MTATRFPAGATRCHTGGAARAGVTRPRGMGRADAEAATAASAGRGWDAGALTPDHHEHQAGHLQVSARRRGRPGPLASPRPLGTAPRSAPGLGRPWAASAPRFPARETEAGADSRQVAQRVAARCGGTRAAGLRGAACWGGDPRAARARGPGGRGAGGACAALGPAAGAGAGAGAGLRGLEFSGKGRWGPGKGKLSGRLQTGTPRREWSSTDDQGPRRSWGPRWACSPGGFGTPVPPARAGSRQARIRCGR